MVGPKSTPREIRLTTPGGLTIPTCRPGRSRYGRKTTTPSMAILTMIPIDTILGNLASIGDVFWAGRHPRLNRQT